MIKTDRYELYNGDCLEVMKSIPDKSVNLVLIDPPYNIGKDKWDKWKTVEDYVEFMGKVFLEIQRVLKDNGSFYFFHNDFLQIVELQNFINKNTEFKFKQLLVWNKRFNEASNKGFLDGFIEVEHLRNYQQMVEYCLFYTFQDEERQVYCEQDKLKSIKKYFLDAKMKCGYSTKKINELLGHRQAEHSFYTKTQWSLPTEDTYIQLQKIMELPMPYQELSNWYNNLRYTYNNQKQHHSVMNYEIAKKQGHVTPKNTDMLEYLIKTSSNENDIVLDCFMGSGSTGVAALNTNRKFIGIELDENYFEIASKRIEEK